MGFKRRIGFIMKSQFNDWVTRAEDPEKVLNQAVQEMEEGLERAKTKIELLSYRVEEEQKYLQKLNEQSQYWQGEAEDFVAKGMNSNARDAVRKRRVIDEELRVIETSLSEDKNKLEKFQERFEELQKRVSGAKTRRSLLLKEISIREGCSESAMGFSAPDMQSEPAYPFTVFNKMEEKVESHKGFSASRKGISDSAHESEKELIDEEIEVIRKKLGKGGSKK